MDKLVSGAALAVVLLSVLSQAALAQSGRGLGDGPVVALRDGTSPRDVAKAIEREGLDPAKATVRARASTVGKYDYELTVLCPLPAGDKRGRVYTFKLRSNMEPAKFRRILRSED
jgi:hypothetical protein